MSSSPPKRRSLRTFKNQKKESALPLHIALAFLIIKIYPSNSPNEVPFVHSVTFTAQVLDIIAREILEISDVATSFRSLQLETDRILQTETVAVQRSNELRRRRGQPISQPLEDAESFESWLAELADNFTDVADGCSFLDMLEKEVSKRISEPMEGVVEFPEPVERRSPLGLFLRGFLITLRKLSFDDTANLARQMAEWCGHNLGGPSRSIFGGGANRKSAMEDTLDKRTGALHDYEYASASGDYSFALTSLRRFYDYQFPTATRGQHQHALLNLASFHYSTGGLESARSSVDEAIRVARAEGDKSCLQLCMSLSHRLTLEMEDTTKRSQTRRIRQAPIPPSRFQKIAAPMDELWAMKAALDMGEPVNIAFRRIYQALGRNALPAKDEKETKPRARVPLDMTSWHASQAGLWTMMGSETLAQLHQDLALELAAEGDARLSVLLSRAERMAGEGLYDEALSTLLDVSTIEGLKMEEYNRWARTVSEIVARRATLSGDTESLVHLESVRPPNATHRSGAGGPVREALHPDPTFSSTRSASQTIHQAQDEIRALLNKAQKMQQTEARPDMILPNIISALELSAQLYLLPMYRLAMVMLSGVLLIMEGTDFASKALAQVVEIWDQVLVSGDIETIALGWLVQGKAKIDLGLGNCDDDERTNMTLLDDAKGDLGKALISAERLGSRNLVIQISSLLGMLAGFSGDTAEQDSFEKIAESARNGWPSRIGETTSISQVVRMVGVRVAEGWR